MLYKLYFNIAITGRAWRLIYNWYHDMKEYVCFDGKHSRINTLHQGTRQGVVLSPSLFLVFVNDLNTELENLITNVCRRSSIVGKGKVGD